MNKTTITAWLARDRNGELWMYIDDKPYTTNGEYWENAGQCDMLDPNLFPSVKWEDTEPTEVEITIKLK